MRIMTSRVLAASLLFLPPALIAQDQSSPRTSVREVGLVTGRIDRIDTFARSVTVRVPDGASHSVYVGPELKIFDELRTGDAVTVRFTESVVVALTPNAKTTAIQDSTAAAKKSATTADVMQQLKATVVVEAVDAATQSITYKGGDNRRVARVVSDPSLIAGLKAGDIVELTYTRERAIELTRNR